MNNITNSEKSGYLFLIFIFIISLYTGFTNLDYFNNSFSAEDGPVEWITAIMLFLISALSIFHLFTLWGYKKISWKLGTILFILLFFFAAGEEISWGQRIFGVESGEFFQQNNAQGETNLHNLVVGETKLNKIIFSQLLMVVMILYLIVSPLLYRKTDWFKNLANRFAVPIVKWHHTIAFILSTLLIVINPSRRKWEVYELAFGVLFFIIFLNPLNKEIFKKEN